MTGTRTAPTEGAAPPNAKVVLGTLILVAAVANLNLSVANVALPSIGASFDSSQTALDLIAVGYSLGLAASVLWFGALGDRYGRKLMIVLGMLVTIPASIVAGFAPNETVLFVARVAGGLAAGMAYPTTLALITALWSGPARTRSIAMWSALGGGVAMLGPLISGLLLEYFAWGSVFLITLPLAVLALFMASKHVPAHVNEATEPVDNIGGVLSAVMIGALVVALNFITVPNLQTLAVGAARGRRRSAWSLFVIRQKRAANPLYDLKIASRSTFWVAAVAGIIVFGSLMGVAFINQQYLQNVLGYDTLQAGAAILPAVIFMVLVAPRSAKLVQEKGSRFTLLLGQAILGARVRRACCSCGAKAPTTCSWPSRSCSWASASGSPGTPSSNSLTGSVPVRRVGMASGHGRPAARPGRRAHDVHLRRPADGRLCRRHGHRHHRLRAGRDGHAPRASSRSPMPAPRTWPRSTRSTPTRSRQRPSRRSSTATSTPTSRAWALCSSASGLTFFLFPKKDDELLLRSRFHAEDEAPVAGAGPMPATAARLTSPPPCQGAPSSDRGHDSPRRSAASATSSAGSWPGCTASRRASATPRWPGLNPMLGIYAGMIPVAVAATATGSVLLMSTLTSAIALTMGGILDSTGYTGNQITQAVFTMSLIAGVLMVVLGVLKLGKVVNYVSNAVMTGLRDGRGHPHHGRQVRRHLRLRPDDVLEQGRQGDRHRAPPG